VKLICFTRLNIKKKNQGIDLMVDHIAIVIDEMRVMNSFFWYCLDFLNEKNYILILYKYKYG